MDAANAAVQAANAALSAAIQASYTIIVCAICLYARVLFVGSATYILVLYFCD
jgi:hypothetical protein